MPFVAPTDPKPVQAKFYVSGVDWQQNGVLIRMAPVTRGEENKTWSQYTPSGELKMFVKNEYASDNFAPGQEWILTFTPADPPEPE